MVIEWLYAFVIGFLKTLFGILPNFPSLPVFIISSIDFFVNLIFDNVGLLGFFIRISTIKILVPSIILVINFEKVYNFIIWIIKKIPLSME